MPHLPAAAGTALDGAAGGADHCAGTGVVCDLRLCDGHSSGRRWRRCSPRSSDGPVSGRTLKPG